jgi:hypothetical protein
MTKNEITARLLALAPYGAAAAGAEINLLLSARYEDLMFTAITEGWNVSAWDIVSSTHTAEEAQKVWNYFGNQITEMWETDNELVANH